MKKIALMIMVLGVAGCAMQEAPLIMPPDPTVEAVSVFNQADEHFFSDGPVDTSVVDLGNGFVKFQGQAMTRDMYEGIMDEIISDCAEHGC